MKLVSWASARAPRIAIPKIKAANRPNRNIGAPPPILDLQRGSLVRNAARFANSGTLLEHVPKKLLDFFDKDMLQFFEFERFLIDHVIPRDREAL
jgi:hypothetical protein